MRDDFTLKTKEQLAKRAGYRCSNPTCNRGTIKPDPSDQASFSNLGVAAHITAASPDGPRYDRTLTPELRRSVTNGIWLCGTCAKEIDDLVYTEELLRHWKRQAEEATVRAASAAPDEIGAPGRGYADCQPGDLHVRDRVGPGQSRHHSTLCR